VQVWTDQASPDAFAVKLPASSAMPCPYRPETQYAKRPHTHRAHASTENVGDPHIVSWQADAPGAVDLVATILVADDLPGIADCSRLPPERWRLDGLPGCGRRLDGNVVGLEDLGGGHVAGRPVGRSLVVD
jgi:hypothetical protein